MKYGPFKCKCFLRPMTVLEDQAITVSITQGLYLILSSVHAVRTVYYRCEPSHGPVKHKMLTTGGFVFLTLTWSFYVYLWIGVR